MYDSDPSKKAQYEKDDAGGHCNVGNSKMVLDARNGRKLGRSFVFKKKRGNDTLKRFLFLFQTLFLPNIKVLVH